MNKVIGKGFAVKQAVYRFVQGCLSYPGGIIRGNIITTYWGFNNFGDLITPFLLRKIGFTPVNSARVSFGNFVFVGSILDSIRDDYRGVILGSGFLNDRRPKNLRQAKILALRGEYTKRLCGISRDIPLGDGGLIFPYFIQARQEKRYKIGIIPHYSDALDQRVTQWKNRFGEQAKVINVLQHPERVFHEVCSCQNIVSSSLHGLVFADSLGIPNLWIELSDLCGNNDFKFNDYYSAFGVSREQFRPSGEESISCLIDRMNEPPSAVKERMEEIYRIFSSLPHLLT